LVSFLAGLLLRRVDQGKPFRTTPFHARLTAAIPSIPSSPHSQSQPNHHAGQHQ
jgi:hypothetical protein